MRRFGLVIILLSVGILILRSNFFNIKKVDIALDKINCTDSETLRDSSGILGQNLIFIDSSKIINNIKNQFICVRKIVVSRQLPNKVKLSVSGREALGKLIKLNGEATRSASPEEIATPSAQIFEGFLVDEDGVVFSKDTEQSSIQSIFIDNIEISPGTKLGEGVTNTLKILERVKIFNLNFQAVQILSNYLIIFPQIDNPKVIFRLNRDIDTQLASLQLILDKAKIDEDILEFIDLRFDKPIVRFAPKKK